MSFLLLFAGFVPLLLGANWLVDGGAALAKRLKVSALVIGLTIVAFGTSAPELVVNIFSSVQRAPSLAVGNIMGSNIFNILIILGISSIVRPLDVQNNTVWKEIPFSLLGALLILIMGNDAFIEGAGISQLSRIDGIVLLAFFIIFIYYSFGAAKQQGESLDADFKDFPIWKSILFIILGLASLVLGGKLIVDSAVSIARSFGMSERIIGLTIVAVGTSLPELATSVIAAIKKQPDIAIGNVVGSNIFNVFFILGISSLIYPLPIAPAVNIDITVTILASVLLFLFVFTGKGRRISRPEGIFLLAVYIGYITFLILKP